MSRHRTQIGRLLIGRCGTILTTALLLSGPVAPERARAERFALDSFEPSPSARRNRVLLQQRAEAVREALIARGVEPERLEAKGFGPDQPIADNETQEGRVQNRRVNLRIAKRASDALEPAPAR